MAAPDGTRAALAAALKDQLRTMPLSRVTVASLAGAAGITRQGFYYHFHDVNALAVWVFENDIADHIMAHASYAEWADGFHSMLVYMQQHRDQTKAVLASLTYREVEQFFYHALRAMMVAIVAELGTDLELSQADRDFVIHHYTLTVLGHLLHWFAVDMRDDPYAMAQRLELILHGSVTASLQRFAASAVSPEVRLRAALRPRG